MFTSVFRKSITWGKWKMHIVFISLVSLFFSSLASFIFYWYRPEKSYKVSNRTWGHWMNEVKISHECWANSGNQDLGVTGWKPVKRTCWVLSSVSKEESQMGPRGQERHRWCMGFHQILVLIPLDIGLRNLHRVQTPFQTCRSCLNPSSVTQSQFSCI